MAKMKEKLYMCVTADKYELPLCVSPDIADVARFCGIQKHSAYSMISKGLTTRIGTQRGKLIRIVA
jgi:hypothetical protein